MCVRHYTQLSFYIFHCQLSRLATNVDTQYANEPLKIQSAPFTLSEFVIAVHTWFPLSASVKHLTSFYLAFEIQPSHGSGWKHDHLVILNVEWN